jgi:hypothetical protein
MGQTVLCRSGHTTLRQHVGEHNVLLYHVALSVVYLGLIDTSWSYLGRSKRHFLKFSRVSFQSVKSI